jgi:hypothetical protein
MARLRAVLESGGEIPLSAATAKTVLQIVAASNHRVALKGFSISFDGVSSSNEPVQIEVLRQTSAGTASAASLNADEGTPAETIQTTGRTNCTAEPTAGAVLRRYECHPQAGYERSYAQDEEILIPGGGRLGIRLTAPNNVNCTGFIAVEE